MARFGRVAIVLLAVVFAFGVTAAALADTFRQERSRSEVAAKREDSDATPVLVDDDDDPNDPTNNTVNDPTNNTVNDPTNNTVNDPTNNTVNDPTNNTVNDPTNTANTDF